MSQANRPGYPGDQEEISLNTKQKQEFRKEQANRNINDFFEYILPVTGVKIFSPCRLNNKQLAAKEAKYIARYKEYKSEAWLSSGERSKSYARRNSFKGQSI